jgi:hypothetical protein
MGLPPRYTLFVLFISLFRIYNLIIWGLKGQLQDLLFVPPSISLETLHENV